MSQLHPAFRSDMVERLRVAVGGGDPEKPAGMTTLARRAAKKVVRRAIAWYVDPVARDTADRAVDGVVDQLRQRDDIPILRINQELLKGELRALLRTVEDLGMAIAPATGIDGAAVRMAELRESIHALERRLRQVAEAPPVVVAATAASAAAPPAEAGPAPAATIIADPLAAFDYTAFERRFRGDPAEILAELERRYFDLLAGHDPVLDVGCGRGELLSALASRGIRGRGVDTDARMAAEAVERGADVMVGDAVAHLRDTPEASLGAVVAIQVLEHLPFATLLDLIELARSRLRPGGVFVAETPNPASLVVLGNSYILDPTHVRPLHPSLLAFLCESAGFRDVRLEFWAPAESYRLGLVEDPDAPPWVAQLNASLAKLNDVLFGPQDYAVVATTAPAT